RERSARSASFMCSVARALFANMKANFALSFNDCRNFFVMLANAPLQLGKFSRQVAICLKNFTQFYESAHDRDIDSHCAFTSQHTRQHRHALLSKCIGQMPSTASPF